MIVQSDPRAPRVVLVGPPGAGKSTIGRKLARELGVELYDTDAGIERETGRTIPEIFSEDGEPEFRRIEERVVRRAILAERGVVSLGGGAVLSKDTRALLRNRTVVYLEISVAEGLRRTGASTQRPLLNGADPGAKYRELMRKRRPLYREVATVRVRTDGRSPGRVVRMIMAKLDMESVLPQDAEPDSTGTAPDTAAATQTQAPKTPGNNRSRARRAARARAAARRRAAAQADGVEPGTTERTKATTATADRTKPTGKISNGPSGSEGSGDTPTPGSRSRRTRARRARARALNQTARTESEPSTRE
jgi:shikimate kinase